jgi:aminopeptidase N
VISNGEGKQSESNENTTWTWIEREAVSTYHTSVVIGNFSHVKKESSNVLLHYYWPKDIEDLGYDAMLTFEDTPNAMKTFEEYFGTQHPYEKYSQVTVDDFEFGGMENASCTTLTRNILHDKRASLDYTFDMFVVAHELAHQWFGDLVTCKDWSHIWLNEGFATYCEALYWEKYWENRNRNRKDEEFHYKILQTADRYFGEAMSKYKRPIVTNLYKNPEELFDDHSYRKGGCVLHMLRYHIGDNNFKKSLKLYLERYSYKAAETDDLRKVLEEVSGTNLQQFFDQWIYRAGHPELEIEYYLEKDSRKLKIKITQAQAGDTFEFPLEIRLIFTNDDNDKKPETVQVSEKVAEYSFDIPKDADVRWISIDPEFKILKEIKSLNIAEEKENFKLRNMLLNQLKGSKTVFERIHAARVYQSDNINN